MNNFWFGDSAITEQEVVIIRDVNGDEFAVSLKVNDNDVELVLTKREMLKCLEALEFEESAKSKYKG